MTETFGMFFQQRASYELISIFVEPACEDARCARRKLRTKNEIQDACCA